MVDIDGVLSLFGVPDLATGARAPAARARSGAPPSGEAIQGSLHSIDGMLHFLSSTAAAHLLSLADSFELVWASGWEEKADEHLPHLLGVPARLPFLRFSRDVGGRGPAYPHWKLEAIEAYAGQRPLAWVDDAFNAACHEWAGARRAPTLLVQTEPTRGLTAHETKALRSWALELGRGSSGRAPSSRAREPRAG
ncbi:MAG: HAD domain-containing protein [Solirubrobacteraceae bacterium]